MSLVSLDRRNFLKIGAGFLLTPVFSNPLFAQNDAGYDYIIIGSGAGGGTLAARLAEKGFKILILEAGEDHRENINVKVPSYHLISSADPKLNWNYYVNHYPEVKMHGKRFVKEKGMLYPRASAVGGCTTHNAMVAMLPDDSDWEYIAKLNNDISWSPILMQKYFSKVKEWLPIEEVGPELLSKDIILQKIILAAALKAGHLQLTASKSLINFNSLSSSYAGFNMLNWNNRESNTFRKTGFFTIQQSTRNGRRYSTQDRLLEIKKKYPNNLTILKNAFVHKIDFKKQSGKLTAIGVQVSFGLNLYQAHPLAKNETKRITKSFKTNKEVILSAGVFNSPQLLMLSGIGDKNHLKEHNIPCLHHLPGVGSNLQDRYEISTVTEHDQDFKLLEDIEIGNPKDKALIQYQKDPQSHLYRSNGFLAAIKMKSNHAGIDPDLILFVTPSRFEGYGPGFEKKALNKKNFLTWAVLKAKTHNPNGKVRLRSSNPFEAPEINFNYFSNGIQGKNDLDSILEGLKMARSINDKSSSLLKNNNSSFKEVFPGDEIKKDDKSLRNFIRKEAWGHHASCSNPMGPSSNSLSVVDTNFKVHGVNALRIVDASIFPKIPGMFIVLPIFMIAEKAAEVIANEN